MIHRVSGCSDDASLQRCAACGFNCLHIERVLVFWREEDSSENGLTVVVDDSGADTHHGAGDLNPSRRRNGIIIRLWCEGCSFKTDLNYWEHKGELYLTVTAEQ